jgi:hypothetical protein
VSLGLTRGPAVRDGKLTMRMVSEFFGDNIVYGNFAFFKGNAYKNNPQTLEVPIQNVHSCNNIINEGTVFTMPQQIRGKKRMHALLRVVDISDMNTATCLLILIQISFLNKSGGGGEDL